jgi:ATP-binding cassette subfamily B protein
MWQRLGRMWQLLDDQRPRYLASLGAMVLAVLFDYLIFLVIMVTVDLVVEQQAAPNAAGASPVREAVKWFVLQCGGAEVLRGHLWIAAVAVLALALLRGLAIYLRGRWSAIATEIIGRRLRDRLYNHLQRVPCAYFDQADTGDLVQRCTSDVETVRSFLASQVVEIGRAVVMLAVSLVVLPLLNWRLTLAALVLVPAILIYTIAFFARASAAFKRQDETEGAMTDRIQENLTGIRVVRAFARQEYECRQFAAKNAAYRDLGFALIKLMAWYYPLADFLAGAQLALVLAFGGWQLVNGTIQVGEFSLFLLYVGYLLWPVRQMGRTLVEIGKAFVSMDRLREILGQAEEPAGAALPAARLGGRIVFDGVTFAHGTKEILRGVSFTAEPGQTVAILGPSGAGKSTLINLLLKFYDYGGSITLDGGELRGLDPRAVRSQIGVVMQEPFLYSRSLRENIKLGRWAARDQEMEEASATAAIHETIAGFEGGYDTLVGERGITLSGGQRQRVALARAILKDPPILILDDALSAVDTGTEALILEALQRRRGRHTTLVIAHRLSTLMRADRIVVLEAGRITQAGTHAELLGREGLYRRLWDIQSSLEEDLRGDLSGAGG